LGEIVRFVFRVSFLFIGVVMVMVDGEGGVKVGMLMVVVMVMVRWGNRRRIGESAKRGIRRQRRQRMRQLEINIQMPQRQSLQSRCIQITQQRPRRARTPNIQTPQQHQSHRLRSTGQWRIGKRASPESEAFQGRTGGEKIENIEGWDPGLDGVFRDVEGGYGERNKEGVGGEMGGGEVQTEFGLAGEEGQCRASCSVGNVQIPVVVLWTILDFDGEMIQSQPFVRVHMTFNDQPWDINSCP
jgi:hypothetical protein